MREWAQTAAMRRGPLNGITARHVMKSEKGQAHSPSPGPQATGDVSERLRVASSAASSAVCVLGGPVGLSVCISVRLSASPGASRLI